MLKCDLNAWLSTVPHKWATSAKKEVLINCPKCLDQKQKLSINVSTGAFRCFLCQFAGHWKQLSGEITNMGSQLPDWLAIYAASRGISQSTLQKAGLSAHESGRQVIGTPLYGPEGNVIGTQWRRELGSEEGPRFWITGSPGVFLTRPDALREQGPRLWVVEGQWDALSLAEVGEEAVALCGVGNTKYLDLLPKGRKIYACFDNDLTIAAKAAVEKTADACKASGIRRALVPSTYHDLNDFFVELSHKEDLIPTLLSNLQKSPLVKHVTDFGPSMKNYLLNKELVRGMPTGVPSFDKLLGGGKRLGELTVTHAEAKTGKNTFWHFLLTFWLKTGVKIGYCSRELSPESDVIPNLLTLHFNKNMWKSETEADIDAGLEAMKTWPLYFAEGYGAMDWAALEEWISALCEEGVQYFFIDHLHYLLEDPEDHKLASKYIKHLKAMCKTKNIHIDIIIQPNRLLDGQHLGLSSIKGGAAIGQCLDNLVVLEREQNDPSVLKIKMSVIRSKLGELGAFYMRYNKETTSFVEVERVVEQN